MEDTIMSIKKMFLTVVFVGVFGLVFADGAMFFEGFSAEAENAQQVIVMYNSNTTVERLYLNVALSNKTPTNMCWLIATPTLATFAELSNMYLYSALKQTSDPQLYYSDYAAYDSDGYYGCMCFGAMGDIEPAYDKDDTGGQSSVTVWYSLTNANYIVTAFSSTESNVIEWLTNNGYMVDPAYNGTLNYYVGEEWYFTAIQFNNFRYETSILARLEFETPNPVFPLLISGINSAPVQTIQLLYLSQYRATTSNYNILDVPIENINYIGDNKYDDMYYGYNLNNWDYYDKLNEELVLSNNNAWFIEYAKQIYLSSLSENIQGWYYIGGEELDKVILEVSFVESPIWLTRFYTKVATNQMRDIYFVPAECNTALEIYKSIEIYDGQTNIYYGRQYYGYKRFINGAKKASAEVSLLLLPFAFIWIRRKKKKKV